MCPVSPVAKGLGHARTHACMHVCMHACMFNLHPPAAAPPSRGGLYLISSPLRRGLPPPAGGSIPSEETTPDKCQVFADTHLGLLELYYVQNGTSLGVRVLSPAPTSPPLVGLSWLAQALDVRAK